MLQDQLLQKVVLNEKRITEIRERIQVRYHAASSEQKSRILAKAIHRLIDGSLPNFSIETKKSIRTELIKHKLTKNSLSISANDIMKYSIELATREEIEKEMSPWITENLETDPQLAIRYLEELYQDLSPVHSNTIDSVKSHKEVPMNNHTAKHKRWKQTLFFLGAAAVLLLLFIARTVETQHKDVAIEKPVEHAAVKSTELASNDLPPHMQYKPVNDEKLRSWLNGRNSLLADEPYFSTILQVAVEFNINPLLLFAITGQEQGFVARDHEKAQEIANNPFNVYHSWEDFNTDILESSQIAARTIVNLSKERPEDVDPIQWINRKYAEDENWWKGVSAIYSQLVIAVQ